MRSNTWRSRRFAFLVLSLLATTAPAGIPAAAQARAAPAATAVDNTAQNWLYVGSDVPQDKEWIFGRLPNGLRYAVRHNGVPPDQVSVRVLVDAGSFYETDAQQGFAHLIEHLTFRDSKYLKSGEAIPTWQRLGATFGSDTNAETSGTQTVYKLDLPDATPAKLDETFKLLSGMIAAPIFTPQGVKTEVPIVLAEMRERSGPQTRVMDATRELFFAGQPAATRSPIGKVETLQAATPESIKAFHDKWYRPDNTIIVVAGDADPQAMLAQITKWFGPWTGNGPKPAPVDFGKPVAPKGANPANPVDGARVLVEPSVPMQFNYAVVRPWKRHADTIAYNQGLMIDRLAMALINRRLAVRARAGGSFLSASIDQQNYARSADTTLVSVTPLGDDWKAAVADVRSVIDDALASPPSQADIDREVAEFDLSFKVPVETQRTQAGSDLADDITQAVDIRETVANPETVYTIFKKSVPLFTPQAVLAHTRALFKGTVVRGMLTTPRDIGATAADVRAALIAKPVPTGSVRLPTDKLTFAQLPPIGTPGTVAQAQPTGVLGIERLTLSNGVKALLWANDAEPGRIIIRIRFGGGLAAIAPKDAVYASLGDMALMETGFGKVDRNALDELATGRKFNLNFKLDDTAFEFSADTRPSDLKDQLYLFAAKLAEPRWDTNPILRAVAAAKLQYAASGSSPQAVLQRDMGWLLKDKDPRYKVPDPAALDTVTPADFRRVWEPLLAQGPIEVDMFGDFTRQQALDALNTTFGALPARTAANPPPLDPHLPAHNETPVVLTHTGDPNTAAAMVVWPTGGGRTGVHESRQLEILAQIVNNRLFDEMREKIGASYAPQVESVWPMDLPSGGYLGATVQLRPQDLPAFFTAADKIAADLVAAPPTPDEIERVTEPLKQLITRASTGNSFYMSLLEGGAQEPGKFDDIRSILVDYSKTTPQAMQALAARYLQHDRSWRVEVVPEAKK
ncbi:UNVERIFIED_ORG: zinc protease [Sphingomonas sp. R1F5B]